MTDKSFDPYHQWLGIPKNEQPPDHYRLLGVTLFESDANVIEAAANRQMAYVKQCGTGPHSDASQKILNELSTARITLLNAEKKAAYDSQLKAKQQPAEVSVPELAPPIVVTDIPEKPGSVRPAKSSSKQSNLGVIIAVVLGGVVTFGIYKFLTKSESDLPTGDPIAATTPEQLDDNPATQASGERQLTDKKPLPDDSSTTNNDQPKPDTTVASTDTKPPTNPKSGATGGSPSSADKPSPTVAAKGKSVDLLKLIDPKRDAVKGDWKVEEGVLVVPVLRTARLQLPHKVPEEYELTITTEGQKQDDSFLIGLVAGDAQFGAYLNYRASVSGLGMIAGQEPNKNDSLYKGVIFTPGKPSTIVYRVTRSAILITCDGREIINWKGDQSTLSLYPTWAVRDKDALFLGSGQNPYRITRITLTPLSADETPKLAGTADEAVFSTKSFVDDHEGFAGIPNQDHIYKLSVTSVTDTRSLRMWINAARPSDSFGDVLLTDPDGKSSTVYSWTQKDFDKEIGEIESYQELTPIEVDVTKLVKIPGSYKVEFKFQKGNDRLNIYRVQLDVLRMGTRRAVPELAALKEAEKAIKDLFKDEFAAAKKPEQKYELAKLLLKEGINTTNDPVSKYVLLTEARDLAADIGVAETALSAVENLAEGYEVDLWEAREKALSDSASHARFPPQNKALVEITVKLIHVAVAENRYDRAVKLASIAVGAARKARDKNVSSQAFKLRSEVLDMRKNYDVAQKSAAILKERPDDPAANFAWGGYLCLKKNDWPAGLPLLAKSGDADLKKVIELDLTSPTDPKAQVKLADVWWDWIESSKKKKENRKFRTAAHYWYTKAGTRIDGLAKVKVEKRLKEIGEVKQPRSASPGTNAPVVVTDSRTASSGKIAKLVQLRKWPGESGTDVGFIKDGKFCVGCRNQYTYIWDLATGEEVKRLTGAGHYLGQMAVAPDGRHIIRGFRRSAGVFIFSTESGELLRTFTGHTKTDGMIQSVDVSPDSSKGVSAGGDGTIRLWEIDTAKELLKLDDQQGIVKFLPDGRFLSARGDKVHIWNPKTGEETQRLSEHTSDIKSVAVSLDGEQLAVGLAGGEIWIWQLQPQRLRGRILAPETGRVSFSADSGRLLSSGSGKLALWDLKTGQKIASAEQANATGVAISPDGKHALSNGGSTSGTILWKLP